MKKLGSVNASNPKQDEHVWVPDATEGFVLGVVIQNIADDRVLLRIEGTGHEKTVCREELQSVNPAKLDKIEDMSSLSYLNEACVLHNLRQRYYSSLIYTYSGLFCVVVNPYKWMPHIYSATVMKNYRGRKRHEVPPHVFAVTDCAYHEMLHQREDQSILCTGESGAGKTENTKKVVQYLADIAGTGRHMRSSVVRSPGKGALPTSLSLSPLPENISPVGHLEDQLLLANPILEAFGNSKTVKNDNSSRFGKFIRINFDQCGCISGANIEHYLLEKSRTIRQAADERSFHFFYQLLLGSSVSTKSMFLMDDIDNYRFLTNGNLIIPDVDDASELSSTLNAMRGMDFSDTEIDAVMRVTSAILLLGNMSFTEDRISDQAILVDDRVAQKICCLLGLPVSDLAKAFLKPRVKVGRDYVHKAQTREQVQYAVEAIAKASYERLFRWLVMRINRSLGRSANSGTAFIGILDIAGFEIFQLNTFEQLCINYTNEKLQQLFNNTMFILEQEMYRKEGIEWNFIDFGLDLQPTIDLIEKPLGVLSLLDEQCIFPKSTDKSYVEKLTANQSKHPKFIVPEFRTKSDFAIVHYAGRVDYSADQWLMKNMDPLNDSVVFLLQNSGDQLVAEMWKNAEFASLGIADQTDYIFGARTKRGMFRTVGQTYKEQLSRLMKTLQNTSPHFVRCIIPNHEKKAGVINGPLVLEQLRCNGVLEGIRICRQGFPNRTSFHDFRRRYELLVNRGTIPAGFLDGKETVRRILVALEVDASLFRIGQSKVFFRSGVIAALEEMRDKELQRFVAQFQTYCRGYLARRAFKKLLQQISAIRIIQRNGLAWSRLKDWKWWRLFAKVKPLLEVTASEQAIAAKESELNSLRETLLQKEYTLSDYTNRIEQLTNDRAELQKLLKEESVEKTEIEDMKDQLVSVKMQLEKEVEIFKQKFEEKEVEWISVSAECKKLQDDAAILRDQLREENKKYEQLQLSNASVDQKLKTLMKEKTLLEGRLTTATQKIVVEEERNRQNVKLRAKLETKITDYKEENEKMRKHIEMTEAANQKLTTEMRDVQDENEELLEKLNELSAQLQKKDEELIATLTHSDEEQSQKQNLMKQTKELILELQEVKEDLENEKNLRTKSEKGKRDCMEELEALKQELLESQDKTQANMELRTEREKQYLSIKKELEETAAQHERNVAELKAKHSQQLNSVRIENEQLKKQMEQVVKTKSRMENELQEKIVVIQRNQSAFLENERKRKNVENLLNEWQTKAEEAEKNAMELKSALIKVQSEVERLTKELESSENVVLVLHNRVATAEVQATDLSDAINVEKSQNEALRAKLQIQDDELESLQENKERNEFAIQKCEKEISSLKQQLTDVIKKNDENLLLQAEELRKKLTKEMEACKKELEQSEYARARSEKAKEKLVQEKEDMLNELDKLRCSVRDMEKKQRKFDQMLEEEKSHVAKVSMERDKLAQELRDHKSSALVTAKEIDILKSRITELENIRNALQMDLDNAVTMKDDTGRNILELDRMKRQLEIELANAKETITELEDNLQLTEDAKLRLDVTLQAVNIELERTRNDKERDDDERRKVMLQKLGDLESELESERHTRLTLMQQKRKLEADLHQSLEQVEAITTQKEEFSRQLRKYSLQLKDLQLEVEESKDAKNAAMLRTQDMEKKLKSLVDELARATETNMQLTADRRRAERERDDAVEELGVKSSLMSTEDKKRLETKIHELEELLEEEQNNSELSNDKLKKAQIQLETLTTELAAERSLCEKLEADKQYFEKQCKDLKVTLEEMENDMRTRNRGQLAALEAKLQAANEQYAQMEQERNTAIRQIRRMEKKLSDTLMMNEEEKRSIEQLKDTADRAMTRHRQMRRQIEDLEEEACRERSKCRQLQRSIDDLNEANETLTRENAQLKSLAALARRSGLNRASTSRFGSETDSIGRGARSFGGDSTDLLRPNSGSTAGSYAGDDPDLTTS
ncbi:myosin [Loa loa]|uniref:Myosin n=1 Tax=Loa loa TaxID=7209 RepID=A0A1S0U792_LOALO|nr:myosin [Loa loa]EFO26078.1 myosin [Loa loa]